MLAVQICHDVQMTECVTRPVGTGACVRDGAQDTDAIGCSWGLPAVGGWGEGGLETRAESRFLAWTAAIY